MVEKIRVYMAGPLFTLAERAHNKQLAIMLEALEPKLQCVLPQEAVVDMTQLEVVANDCFAEIDKATLVVACADGAESDSGTAIEIGYAKGRRVPSIVYRTDFRGSEIDGVNAMVRFGCTRFINLPAYSTSLEKLAVAIVQAIHDLGYC